MYSKKPLLHARQKSQPVGALRSVALDVTGTCNMTCQHCYAETFRKVEALALPVLLDVLEELYELGVSHYVLQGGEPILVPKRLEAILRGCHPDETYITVVSNGWSMTPERIAWLDQLKVDKIAFSMDSGIPDEHDANRLKGSFARVEKAVEDVLAVGLFTSVSTMVTHTSLYEEGFERALAFARAKGIRLDVQIAEPVGKWDGQKEDLITPEDAAYLKQVQASLGQLPSGQDAVHRDIYTGDCDHCPAGTDFMSISADGQLLPCNFLQFTLGKVGEQPIAQMRGELLASRWFDGKRPNCICGEDDEFIDSFIVPYVGRPKPLSAHEVFKLPRKG